MRTYIHLAHQGWGNKIDIQVPDVMGGRYITFDIAPETISGSGCLTPFPIEKELIVILSTEGLVSYEITEVRMMGQVRDGFFFEAKKIGVVGKANDNDRVVELNFEQSFLDTNEIVKYVDRIMPSRFIQPSYFAMSE